MSSSRYVVVSRIIMYSAGRRACPLSSVVAGRRPLVNRTWPGSQWDRNPVYNSETEVLRSADASLCNLYPGIRSAHFCGINGCIASNMLSHAEGGSTGRAELAVFLSTSGKRSSSSHQTWRLYPPKSSSPPSPERLTVTFWRARRATRYVGICDESANGSS
jgi:hypothetical protein